MCTSIAYKTDSFYFGRNMDLEYSFGERVTVTPRSYPVKFRNAEELKSHYAVIGMACVAENYPLYADAVNEKGLCMAGLNFPGNAFYSDKLSSEKYNISPFEIILWVLCRCENVGQAKALLEKTQLVAVPFSESVPLACLHWHIADKNSSIVLECTESGMKIYDNPVNVLTNNPSFDFQMTNLSQYLNLGTGTAKNCFTDKAGINAFGKGCAGIGLPGDFSPASRFVKAAFLTLSSVCRSDKMSSVSQLFHLLDSVAVVNGGITLENEAEYFTTYSCCINAEKGIYYYKTYNNSQISAVNIFNENLDANMLREFPLLKKQQIFRQN